MVKITINILADKVSRVVDAYKGLFEIPVDEKGKPTHTDEDWAKEQIRKDVVRKVQIWEEIERKKDVIELDDTIATLE